MIYIALSFAIVAMALTVWMAVLFHHASKAWRKTQVEFLDSRRDLWRRVGDLRSSTELLQRGDNRQDLLIEKLQEAVGPTWTTGIGTKLRIRDMTDCHLRNAIAWCEQHGKNTTDLRAELKLRRRNKRMEAQQ